MDAIVSKIGRNLTIDAAKGIAIVLVVFAHINYTPAPLAYIYSFHMPLFFILSGLLFRREKYETFSQFLRHRFYTLVCPYLFFYAAALLVRALIAIAAQGIAGILTSSFLKSLIQMFLAWGPSGTPNNPLWFVPCLFCVELMYFFICKTKRWCNISICILLVFIGWFLKSEYLSLRWLRFFWNFDISLFAIGYYALGNLLSKEILRLLSCVQEHRYKNFMCVCAALLCAVILIPLAARNGKISLGSGIFGNGLLLYATGMIGTLGVLFAAVVLQRSRFLCYLGRNTFSIMGTHVVIRDVLNTVCSAIGLGVYDNKSILQSILPFLLVLTASLICTMIYNRMRAMLPFAKKA